MAVNTLQYIADLFKGIVAPEKDVVQLFERHLPLFNASQLAVWKILTSRKPFNNWFVVQSQSSTPAAADYFGPLVTTTREYALPPNFKHLRLIESLTAGYEHLRFIKSNLDDEDFREGRRLTSNNEFTTDVLYDIAGVNPGTMVFSRYPPAALTLRLWYVRTPTELTARGDVLSDFPIEAIPLMARWAAGNFLLGADPRKWEAFERQWSTEVDRMVFGEMRDDTGSITAKGYLE